MIITEKINTLRTLSDLQQEMVDMWNEVNGLKVKDRSVLKPVLTYFDEVSEDIEYNGCVMLFGKFFGPRVHRTVLGILGR